MYRKNFSVLLVGIVAMGWAAMMTPQAQDNPFDNIVKDKYTGRFVSSQVEIFLLPQDDQYAGTLSFQGTKYKVQAWGQEGYVAGEFFLEGKEDRYPFTVKSPKDRLYFQSGEFAEEISRCPIHPVEGIWEFEDIILQIKKSGEDYHGTIRLKNDEFSFAGQMFYDELRGQFSKDKKSPQYSFTVRNKDGNLLYSSGTFAAVLNRYLLPVSGVWISDKVMLHIYENEMAHYSGKIRLADEESEFKADLVYGGFAGTFMRSGLVERFAVKKNGDTLQWQSRNVTETLTKLSERLPAAQDIAVKTDGPSDVCVHGEVTCRITIKNLFGTALKNLTLQVLIPPELELKKGAGNPETVEIQLAGDEEKEFSYTLNTAYLGDFSVKAQLSFLGQQLAGTEYKVAVKFPAADDFAVTIMGPQELNVHEVGNYIVRVKKIKGLPCTNLQLQLALPPELAVSASRDGKVASLVHEVKLADGQQQQWEYKLEAMQAGSVNVRAALSAFDQEIVHADVATQTHLFHLSWEGPDEIDREEPGSYRVAIRNYGDNVEKLRLEVQTPQGLPCRSTDNGSPAAVWEVTVAGRETKAITYAATGAKVGDYEQSAVLYRQAESILTSRRTIKVNERTEFKVAIKVLDSAKRKRSEFWAGETAQVSIAWKVESTKPGNRESVELLRDGKFVESHNNMDSIFAASGLWIWSCDDVTSSSARVFYPAYGNDSSLTRTISSSSRAFAVRARRNG